MAAEDPVVIDVRTDGVPKANSELKSLNRTIGAASGVAKGAAAGLQNFARNTQMSTLAQTALGIAVYQTGSRVLGLGGMAVRAGIQFNATQEQAQVAFTQLLGSAQAARQEFSWLQTAAANTPFQLPQITQADRQLLAYNFSLKETHGWLETIADTSAGAGLGAEGIDRMVTAVGQIRSKGFLQGDELQQLSELGVLDRNKLAKDLNVTTLELSSGNARIPADKALRAIRHQLNDTFGGQSAAQAKTFNGQLSNIQDNLDKTLGTITKPGFEYLRNKVFPAVGDATSEINKIFDRTDINTSEKIQLSRDVLDRQLGPFADAIGDQIKAAHLPEKIGDEFGQAIPLIAAKMGDAAPAAAGAFATAWLHSGPWGQFLSAAWLAKKTGAFGALGKMIGGKGGGTLDALAGRGSPTNPLYVIVLDHGVPGLSGGKGGTVKKTAGWLEKLGPFAGPIGVGVAGGAAAGLGIGDLLNLGPFGTETAKPLTAAQRNAGRQRAIDDAARRGNITRAEAMKPAKWTGDRSRDLYAVLEVDGKKMAETVVRNVQDAGARRR